MKKRMLISLLAIIMTANTLPIATLAASPEKYNINLENNVDLSKRDKIGYQYKTIDNVLYKRLYNFTTNKPLSDWEKCK